MGTLERKHLTEPSPSDWDRWEARLLAGEEPSESARLEGQTCSNFRRQDAKRHAEALVMSREARGYYVDRAIEADVIERDKDGEPRFKADVSDTQKQFWAKRWQPHYAGTQKVELTGADGGPLEVADARERLASRVAGIASRTGEEPASS